MPCRQALRSPSISATGYLPAAPSSIQSTGSSLSLRIQNEPSLRMIAPDTARAPCDELSGVSACPAGRLVDMLSGGTATSRHRVWLSVLAKRLLQNHLPVIAMIFPMKNQPESKLHSFSETDICHSLLEASLARAALTLTGTPLGRYLRHGQHPF